ncbi:hypothetical protein [Acinetobacter sp. YH1901134]|uniref:hypothetical protein n=1 Tax=Acinetobacter sp. YH1901134 TaxID=2601199 RepID=UPI0015D273CC|nr:hypothetical protein [Acinetobacter sp. YH1901134]
MAIDLFIINYLKKTYGENGNISKQFENIFRTLDIDKNQAIDAFYEVYSTGNHPALFKDTSDKELVEFPSTKILRRFLSIAPPINIQRLALAYIVAEITIAKILQLNTRMNLDDIHLALKNIEVINLDLGAFIQCIDAKPLNNQEKNLKQSIQALGGLTRSRKYQILKKQIFNDWNISNYHSYAECARKHAGIHSLSTKTIESWLSKEFSKPNKE